MRDLKEAAIEAAQRAGRVLMEGITKEKKVSYKSSPIDLVTEFDRRSQEVIVGFLRDRYPEHGILAEEGIVKQSLAKQSDYIWIIDPLDGTTNFAHGYPMFCVSIALEVKGEIVLGVVYNPFLGELFVAELKGGATLNGEPISVSKTKSLRESLLATGFSYKFGLMERNLGHFSDFIYQAQAVRRDGSAALDLCYVAMGRFDGLWELDLKPWDVAAGFLIVQEAGGLVTDFSGNRFNIYGSEILASNGHIHQEMIRVLANCT
jgi:myo-inositol-1(or 4)-monophosphatase